MNAVQIPIKWDTSLSIYASEPFLKAVGDEYGWVGGFDQYGNLRCVLPFTIIKKSIFRMVRFRVETIPFAIELSTQEEKAFLNSALKFFCSIKVDMIIPASTNTIFREYPDRAIAAPYGSYILDLNTSEEILWSNLHSKHRNVIRNAINKGVQILAGKEYIDEAYGLIRDTFDRSSLPFMAYAPFKRMVCSLGQFIRIYVAKFQGAIQGCAVIPFSGYSAYYVYGGSIPNLQIGSMNLLQWEAIRQFRNMGVNRYDFCGARIHPEKGSKQAGLAMFKERFGAQLSQGYIWKCALHPMKFAAYSLAVRVLRGGDIVDYEKHKIEAG